MSLPPFLVKRVPKQNNIRRIRQLLGDDRIHTVCEAASCPNIGECFARNTLTFMILGDVCTRRCRFCAVPTGRQGVAKGQPLPLDPTEPVRVAAAVKKLGLDYVVVTSVTRDDLLDGGAGQFAAVINELRITNYALRVEVLIPDLQGDWSALARIVQAGPYVLNHNVETVPRLYSRIRPQADYQRSLELLKRSKLFKEDIYTKSGFMVGLGESQAEIFQVVKDLADAGCDIVTIGQYLAPSRKQAPVVRYVEPAEFAAYRSFGEELGLRVVAGPFVRSSYHAQEATEGLR